MAGVEPDLDPVGGREVVAPAETHGNTLRVAVVAAHGDIQKPVVVGDLGDRPFTEKRQVLRFPMHEVVDAVGNCPDLVIEDAIDRRCGVCESIRPQGLTDLRRGERFSGVTLHRRHRLSGRRVLGRRRACTQADEQDTHHEASAARSAHGHGGQHRGAPLSGAKGSPPQSVGR